MPKGRLVFTGDDAYTEKVKRVHKLTPEVESKIDAIPGVVDNAESTSSTDALSARVGKILQDQITELKGVGTFLSVWDCTTGLPITDPVDDPYTYKEGNYYIVGNVGATNYKPYGSTYTHGVASVTVETDTVSVNDWYLFDGTTWVRQPAGDRAITIDDALSGTSTNAVENRVVKGALDAKQAVIADLASIRSGAAAGATALQRLDNISELTNNLGFQTAGDVASAISTATSGLATASSVTSLGNRVTTAEGNISSIQGDISSIQGDITSIQGDIGDIQTTLTNDLTPLVGLDTTVSNLSGDVSSLQTTVGGIQQAIDGGVVYKGSSAPANPSDGELWYNTNTQVLNIYNSTSQTWGPVDTNTTYQAGTNITITSAGVINASVPSYQSGEGLSLSNNTFSVDFTAVEKKIQFVTQQEYDNLPATKLTNGVLYFIYSTT